MSKFSWLQMNTVAPGLLCSTQSHHTDTFEEGTKEKRSLSLLRPIKNTYQIDLTEA